MELGFCPARFPLTLWGTVSWEFFRARFAPGNAGFTKGLMRAQGGRGTEGIPLDSQTVVEIDSEHLEWFLRGSQCFLFILEATNRTKKIQERVLSNGKCGCSAKQVCTRSLYTLYASCLLGNIKEYSVNTCPLRVPT